jgi:Flp pilus assembly protein TadG
MPRQGRRRHGESGQIIVLFALVIVLLMGMVALAVDVGVLRSASQNLWNALDAGTLAAASQLRPVADPGDGAQVRNDADAMARLFLQKNYPGGTAPNNVTVTFRCVVGSNSDGTRRTTDVPAVCDPGGNVSASDWQKVGNIWVAPCNPAEGDTCNTVVLSADVTVPFGFGNAIGVPNGSTGTIQSAACRGPCGAPPESPMDVVLVVDRTPSMDSTDIANVRSAAQTLRQDANLNPVYTWLAFGMIGPSVGSGSCPTEGAPTLGTINLPADLARWMPIGLSGTGAPVSNYKLAGSPMANAMSCFDVSPGSVATDLADPMTAARYILDNSPRAGTATQGIIFMTDGLPNNSVSIGGGSCSGASSAYIAEANTRASAAKASNISVFTVGFGLEVAHGSGCGSSFDGPNPQVRARQLLASMASPVDGVPAADDGCNTAENEDGDNFFCVPKAGGAAGRLAQAFRTAINSLSGTTRLISLP